MKTLLKNLGVKLLNNRLVQKFIETVVIGVLAPLAVKLINKMLNLMLVAALKVAKLAGKIVIWVKVKQLELKVKKMKKKKGDRK